LIHVEQVWAENCFTTHGNLLHERVDSCDPEQRGKAYSLTDLCEPETFRRDHSSAYHCCPINNWVD